MGRRPPAVVAERGEDIPSTWPGPGWSPTGLDELPAEPFDLGPLRLVVHTAVDPTNAGPVLLAATRGVALACTVDGDGDWVGAFVDDIGRLTDLDATAPAPSLDDEQVNLLDALADGATLTDAAHRLGLSRRTATRRLTDARRILGVTSTAAAVARHRRDRCV